MFQLHVQPECGVSVGMPRGIKTDMRRNVPVFKTYVVLNTSHCIWRHTEVALFSR